jgi:hypothetical protein
MNKFKVGQKVKSSDGDTHVVLAFSFDSERGFVYKVSSKEVDMVKKELVEGISHYSEKELKGIKSE